MTQTYGERGGEQAGHDAGDTAVAFVPTAVALDIDGTLLDADDRISPRVRAGVARARERVPVILSSGRPWHSLRRVAGELGLPAGYLVCANGAMTMTYPAGEIVAMHTFDPTTAIAAVREHAPTALLAVEDLGRGFLVSEPFPPDDLSGEHRVVSDTELAAEPVTRLVIRDPRASQADFLTLADKLGLHGVGYFVGYTAWLDIAPEGVDKSTGLATVLAAYGLDPSGLLAVGDGRNDVEMLRYAGHGVAMGGAPDVVVEAADAVTGHVLDDGLADVLDRFF